MKKDYSSCPHLKKNYIIAGLILLACVFSTIFQHYSFKTGTYDTGIYSNVAWNVSAGNGFYSSFLHRNDLGEHFSPIMVIFAPLMRIVPTTYWLVGLQGIAVGLFFFIIIKLFCFLTSQEKEPSFLPFLTCLIFILSFIYAPLISALCAGFHPSTLGVPLVGLAILMVHKKQNLLLWISILLLLTLKESAILVVIGIGVYAWLMCDRKKLALSLFLVAGIAALIIFEFVLPHFRGMQWDHYDRLGFSEHWGIKSHYLFLLVAELGFLPLFCWRALIPAFIPIILNLSVKYSPQFSLRYHYDDLASVFLLLLLCMELFI